MTEEKYYEVTLHSPTKDNVFGYNTWTMVWKAASFADAEKKTYEQLDRNDDSHSFIFKIELY
jgi:hypothetical protein